MPNLDIAVDTGEQETEVAETLEYLGYHWVDYRRMYSVQDFPHYISVRTEAKVMRLYPNPPIMFTDMVLMSYQEFETAHMYNRG